MRWFAQAGSRSRPTTPATQPSQSPQILSPRLPSPTRLNPLVRPSSLIVEKEADSLSPYVLTPSHDSPSSPSGMLSTSPKLAASLMPLSSNLTHRQAPAVPPTRGSETSTPAGFNDGGESILVAPSASVRAFRDRFGTSSNTEFESSSGAQKSVVTLMPPSAHETSEQHASVTMTKRSAAPMAGRSKTGGEVSTSAQTHIPEELASIPTHKAGPVIGQRDTKKKPPPPPPPLSRSASPAIAQQHPVHEVSLTRSTSTRNPIVSSPQLSAQLSEASETSSLPPLPARKSTQATPDPGMSPIVLHILDRKLKSSGILRTASIPPIDSRAPPLPERSQAFSIDKIDDHPFSGAPPRLPIRSKPLTIPSSSATSNPPHSHSSPIPSSPRNNRDTADSYIPPPPPLRSTVAGVFASPPRRETTKNTEVSSEEGEEEDTVPGASLNSVNKRMLEDSPNSTHANRCPPAYVPDIRISSPHHVHSFTVFGRYVCTGAHHVRIYDTQMSDRPIFTVDLKDVGLDFRIKEPRVTAMCFRPVNDTADEGRFLWCGTKDGHLWELDIKTGKVTDTRSFVHASAVVNIFRYRKWLLTLEESGKLLVFEIAETVEGGNAENKKVMPELVRSHRLPEKFTFAKMIRGKLWMSSAPANRSTTDASSRGASIRVFQPCATDPMPPGSTIFTSEWTGAVTSATLMPLKPGEVYLGHEGGFVSSWSEDDLACLRVFKISSSDILALEGVGQRLWAGNRKGQIHVYDVAVMPWQVTNIWTAHPLVADLREFPDAA